jgi:hypothetical protein
MTQATGANTVLGVFEETAYKTLPVTVDAKKLYVTKNGISYKQNLMDSAVLTNSRGKARPFLGNKDTSGSIDIELGAENSGILLKHLMGGVTDTGAGPYTHVYKIGTLPVGLGFETDYGAAIAGSGRFIVHHGVRISSANFTFPQEGAITASFSIVGSGKHTAGSATVDTAGGLTDTGHTTFSGFQAAIEEGGAAIATVKSASIEINNELETGTYVIGSAGERVSAASGMAMVSGSVTAIFSSAALMNKALAGTASSLKVTLTRGDGLGSAGNESMVFLVENLIYEPAIPTVDGPAGIEITLPFKAFKVSTDLGLTITVKNAVATV